MLVVFGFNFLLFLLQKEISGFLKEIFAPLIMSIFNVLNEPFEENEEEEKRHRKLLQRSYYLFLATIVTNNLIDVLAVIDPPILHQVKLYRYLINLVLTCSLNL